MIARKSEKCSIAQIDRSTPPRAGRHIPAKNKKLPMPFQSTPPRGGATYPAMPPQGEGHVSTHAPARGATWEVLDLCSLLDGFNPRPCAGGDVPQSLHTSYKLMFQSTPLRGGRHGEGQHRESVCRVSIHAPARGATSISRLIRNGHEFQSTPLRGGRRPTP